MKYLQKVRFDMWLRCVGLVVQYMDAGREGEKTGPPPSPLPESFGKKSECK
jgi:hypothetical protein